MNCIIVDAMGITVRYVQMLWARFKGTPKDKIVFPTPMGRPRRGPPARSEQSAVLSARPHPQIRGKPNMGPSQNV